MTEQEKKMWQDDLDMISKLNKEVDELHNRIDKAIKYINDNLIISSILDGKKYYTINNYSFDYRELLDILKGVIDKAINNSQYWIDYYTRLNSDERIALRLQENIDILKKVE